MTAAPATHPATSCALPDGRRLAFAEYGDPSGVPLLSLHGTPGGRLLGRVHEERWARQGLRVITPERPGYGESDASPGRTVRSFADDLVVLLDQLGLDRVFVVGGSGGGPHALALAVAAPERVRAVGVMVGAAPLLPAEVAQQVGVNQAIHGSVGDPAALRAVVEQVRQAFLDNGVAAVLHDAPESDRVQWERVADLMDAGLRAALAPGAEGLIDDFLALWGTPWGFEPEDVQVPVVWAHGTTDKNVPMAAARRVADRLPNCRFVVWEDVGHAPTPDLNAELLTALLARVA